MRSFGAILLPLRFNKIIGGATRVVEIEKLEKVESLKIWIAVRSFARGIISQKRRPAATHFDRTVGVIGGQVVMQAEKNKNNVSRGHGLQDPYLNALSRDKTPVSIFLVNGIKLQGQIESFDQFVILLKSTVSQMVYKHGISTVVPSKNVTFSDHE